MSVENTLAERGARYGDFTDHAKIAQGIQRVMQTAERASPVIGQSARPLAWACLSDVQRQALTVIADKIARILSGDPNYADNWHDIQGYAKLVEDRLPVEFPDDFGQQHVIEPAAAIDDDSQRMQAIGQNGNGGEHYDAEKLERWKDAPDGATHWGAETFTWKEAFYKLDGEGIYYHLPGEWRLEEAPDHALTDRISTLEPRP